MKKIQNHTEQGTVNAQSSDKQTIKQNSMKLKVTRKKRRGLRIFLLILAGLTCLEFLFRYLFPEGGRGNHDALTDYVQYGSISSTIEGTGIVRAQTNEDVALYFSGIVQEVFVNEGDIVHEGDMLYEIDSEQARKAVAEAEDALLQAQETVTNAQGNVRSAQESVRLAQNSVVDAEDAVVTAEETVITANEAVVTARKNATIATEAIEEAQKGVFDAQQVLQDARIKLAEAQKELSDVKAKSDQLSLCVDWDGMLIDTMDLSPGEKVDSDTLIAVLVDHSQFHLIQWYNNGYQGEIFEGQQALIQTYDFDGLMFAYDEPLYGVVERIYTTQRNNSFSVLITVGNPGAFEVGMSATAFILLNTQDGSTEVAYPEGTGKLKYYRTEELRTQIAGNVIYSDLISYGVVKSGQEVLLLDDSALSKEISLAEEHIQVCEKEVQNAESNVQVAEKGVKTAERNLEDAQDAIEDAQRKVESAKRGLESSKKNVDEARRTVKEREQGVEDAKKNVVEAEKNVTRANENVIAAREESEKCRAIAPIDGIIVGLNLSTGKTVSAGQIALTISDPSLISVQATVDSRDISYVEKGMAVNLNQWDRVSAQGVVESISLSSSVNNGVATYPVTISANNVNSAIQINSEIQYSMLINQKEDCLIIPLQCVHYVSTEDGENMTVVYIRSEMPPEFFVNGVIDDMEVPMSFWPVMVETGMQDLYHVEILSGLEEGWEVFTQMKYDNIDMQ